MTHSGWGDDWAQVAPPVAPPRATQAPARRRRSTAALKRRKRRIVWSIVGVFAVLLALVAVAGVLVARDALHARDQLEQASEAIPGLERRLREDPTGVAADLARVQAQARSAATATRGPLWSAAQHLPFIGENLRAFRNIATTVDDLAQEVLPRVSTVATSVTAESLAPRGGRFDLAPLAAARLDIVAANNAIVAGIDRVSALPRDGLMHQIVDAADTLEDMLRELSVTSGTAARAAELLPPMMGLDGPRDWLILAQNNAQPRATGGIPGALLHLRTDDGALTFEGKASARDFGQITTPFAELTPEEEVLFGEHLVFFTQNLNLTPDFPRTGYLASQAWQQHFGDEITGVLSIDPVALGTLLQAAGPVTFLVPPPDAPAAGELPEYDEVDAGDVEADPENPAVAAPATWVPVTLSSETASNFLLSEIYFQYTDPELQDEVFALAAEAIFAALLAPGVNANAALDALVQVANSDRLLVWSAVPEEQELLYPTILSGALRGTVTLADGQVAPEVGIFLNFTVSGKQGYFMETEYEVIDTVIRPNGSQEFQVRMRFENTMDPATAADLPEYIITTTGGRIGMNLLVYAPTGGSVIGANYEGELIGLFPATHDGFTVTQNHVTVDPGQVVEYVFTIRSGAGQPAPVVLRTTPGPHS